MKPFAFILITYNRPDDLLELLKNLVDLNNANELLEEIIIVNNASTEDYSKVTFYIQSITSIKINYILSNENLGVAKGRNLAISKSKAAFLILLDDDCILQNQNSLTALLNDFSTLNTTRDIAIISFKVLYYDSLERQKNALPHKLYDEYKDKSFFETYYYAGGAHAVKREILEKVGSYPEDFFYGMEEYDLSYRLLDSGYSIVYSDKVVMLHKESPLGRPPKADKLRMMWVNKAKVAYRYLPLRYFYSTSIMWSLQYLRLTRFDMNGLFKGINQVRQLPKSEVRQPVNKTTIDYLKSLKARLWY